MSYNYRSLPRAREIRSIPVDHWTPESESGSDENRFRRRFLLCLCTSRNSESAYTLRRPMRQYQASGPAKAPIGSDYGSDERLFRVPHPSPPLDCCHVRRVPSSSGGGHPLGKPLHSNANPRGTLPQLHDRLHRRGTDLSGPPGIGQPQREVPPASVHRDTWGDHMRRRRGGGPQVYRVRVPSLGREPPPPDRAVRESTRSGLVEAGVDLHRPSGQVLDRVDQVHGPENRVFVQVQLRRWGQDDGSEEGR